MSASYNSATLAKNDCYIETYGSIGNLAVIYGFMSLWAKFLWEEFRRLPQVPVGGLIFTVGGDVGRAGGLGGMCRPKGLLGGGEIWARVGVWVYSRECRSSVIASHCGHSGDGDYLLGRGWLWEGRQMGRYGSPLALVEMEEVVGDYKIGGGWGGGER